MAEEQDKRAVEPAVDEGATEAVSKRAADADVPEDHAFYAQDRPVGAQQQQQDAPDASQQGDSGGENS